MLSVVAKQFPASTDHMELITSGAVAVNGIVVKNPDSMVNTSASVKLVRPHQLRGVRKLGEALQSFRVDPAGWTALDVGAAAGGFTQCLLDNGAVCVYAVDVGHGQISAHLRQDKRVIVLENTNLADLSIALIGNSIQLFTMDLSYLPLGEAVRQISLSLKPDGAILVGLIKPMFELALPVAPTDAASVDRAIEHATIEIQKAGWRVLGSIHSSIGGARGAAEGWVHATFPAAG